MERGAVTQWKANGQCSEGDSVVSAMTQHLATDARIARRKDNRPLPHQIRRHRLANKKPSKSSKTVEEQAFLGKLPSRKVYEHVM